MTQLEMTCPGCQQQLTMSSEYSGQQVRCPQCKSLVLVPEVVHTAVPDDPQDRWRLRTPEGQIFGPVSRANLEAWVVEGRVADDCQLCCDLDGIWRGAADVYPVLRPVPVAKPVAEWYGPIDPEQLGSPDIATPSYRGHVINAHRGGIILAIGIISWAIGCPAFGIAAWFMGSSDLEEMRVGTMDARGQSLTAAGRLIGMVHTLLAILVVVVGLLAVLILRLL